MYFQPKLQVENNRKLAFKEIKPYRYPMEETQLIELVNDEKVVRILKDNNHLDLAKYLGRELCGFTIDDEKYVDLFWEPTFNKSWLYLSDEVIIDWMGYKKSKSCISDFIREMKTKYVEHVDYREVTRDNELVQTCCPGINRGKYNKKYYIITGEALKKMLIRAQTKQGDITCDYFIKVESLCGITTRAIFKYIQVQKENELEQVKQESQQQIAKLESKQLKLESFVRNIKKLDKTQLFYIGTTPNYAHQNRFEYGGVKDPKDLKSRLATYNTGHAEGDLFYYTKIFKCNNYKLIEERLGSVLMQFKDKPDSRKEMIHLRYNLLIEVVEFICDNYDREIEYINTRCQQFLSETIEQDSIVPDSIDLNDYMEITVNKNGIMKQKRIDITDWSDERINQTIEDIINLCANEKKKVQYDFSTQKNSLALELTWSLITPYFDAYNGLTRSAWRNRFKHWLTAENPKQLRIKGIKC